VSERQQRTVDFLDDQIGLLGRERDAAVAQYTALRAALAALVAYVRHKPLCGSLHCARCAKMGVDILNAREDNYLHHDKDNLYFHPFVPNACSCELNKHLAILRVHREGR
jgi:hypothetical protein